MTEKIVQTAGRKQLGEFAPMFAHLNDDVLFGEVWNEESIDVKTKCIITVVSLMASGITDSSLSYEVITQYPQWKKAVEDRTIICIRDLDQVADAYPMELEHYHRLQVQSVIAVPYYKGSTGFLVVRNPQRYMDYPAFMMHVETVVLMSRVRD